MAEICAKCGRKIRNPDSVDTCLGDHDDREEPVFLHDTCPCPDHGFDADREYYVREDR